MNDYELEKLLRENRPAIKDDPVFLLEVKRKIRAAEGIKNEVDRQRKLRHLTMSVTLFIGVAAGIMITAFIGEWKLYIEVAVSIVFALIAIILGNSLMLTTNMLRLLLAPKNAIRNQSTD